MKKMLSLISSAAIAVSMLCGLDTHALEPFPVEYHTFEELMDMSGEELQSMYGDFYDLNFLDMDCTPEERVYEFLGGDSEYVPFTEIMESDDLQVKCTMEQSYFIDTLKIGNDIVLTYSVDTQYGLEKDITPEYFGLPADWDIEFDEGEIKDGKYYVGNSYKITVPYKIAVDYHSFIRLYLQQKLFKGWNKFEYECHVTSYTQPFSAESITGYQPIILGDTEYDGRSISDAVRILSYATNPTSVSMDIFHQRACDIYNHGDGIDAMDSLTLQKYLTNVITELPESYASEEEPVSNSVEISVYDYETNNLVSGAELYIWATYASYCDMVLPAVVFEIGTWTTNGKEPVTITNLSDNLPKLDKSDWWYDYHVSVTPPINYTIAVDGQSVWHFDFNDSKKAEVSIPLAYTQPSEQPQPTTNVNIDPENYAEINVYDYETGERVPGAEVGVSYCYGSNTAIFDLGTWTTDEKSSIYIGNLFDKIEDQFCIYTVTVKTPEGYDIAVNQNGWSFNFEKSNKAVINIPLMKNKTEQINTVNINVYNYETGELVPGAEVLIYAQPASYTTSTADVVWDIGTWTTDGKDILHLEFPADEKESEEYFTSYIAMVTPPEGMTIAIDGQWAWQFDFLESSSVSIEIPLI